MYYWESQDPYCNIDMKYHFKEHLPMDEFAKGNFSQAHKIIDTYREYLKKCITSSTYKTTWGEENISTYLQKELANLEQQEKERTEKKIQAIQEIDDIQKKINNKKQTFKEEGKGNKFWDIYFNYLEKNDWNMHSLKHAFNESTENESKMTHIPKDHIQELHQVFENFIASAPAYRDQLEALGKEIFYAKKRRNEANHMLTHKSNYMNIRKQIDDIKTGKEYIRITNQIHKDIFRTFKKMDHLGCIVDERSLQEIYTSIMTTELITDCTTNKNVKKGLIRSHTDKLGLFDHIRMIYKNNSQMFLQIKTGREHSSESVYYGQLMKEKIEQLAEESKKILEKIPAMSGYFRLSEDASQEEIDIRKNIWENERKKTFIKDLIAHFKESLQSPKEKGHWRRQPDDKLKKFFEGIYLVTDSYEFEKYCERLWDLDANRYREILGIEGKMLLKQIYQAMDPKEQSIITHQYETRWDFDDIIKDVELKKEQQRERQLKLFDFAPIYNLNGYVEYCIEYIKSQIHDISYEQSRTVENALRKTLQDQWYKGYIDTWADMLPISDVEFIEKVKKCRWGKIVSLRLKKANSRLLPDINERIVEMKKTIKGDIR